VVARWIINPVSFEDISSQFKLIWVEEEAIAERLDGATGTVTLPARAGDAQNRLRNGSKNNSLTPNRN